MKPVKTISKGFRGGRRSPKITIKRQGGGGAGLRSFDMGPTLNPPFLYATWNGVFARWNDSLTYWR